MIARSRDGLTAAAEAESYEVGSAGGASGVGAEARALASELETLARGENWHGPTLAELLLGVTARKASERPIASAHTIWELVLHVTAWTDVFRRRIQGEAVEEPEAGDFPVPPAPTPRAWTQATQALFDGHHALVERVAALSDADLSRPIRGRPFDVCFQVRAAIRHAVYHSGQIGLLKKVGGRPRGTKRGR